MSARTTIAFAVATLERAVATRQGAVLMCGKASVTLRRNGKVVIRGTYVETHSDGTNRVKGGQVRIN